MTQGVGFSQGRKAPPRRSAAPRDATRRLATHDTEEPFGAPQPNQLTAMSITYRGESKASAAARRGKVNPMLMQLGGKGKMSAAFWAARTKW